MNRSMTGLLIAKDLHLHRWLIAGTLVAGIVSLFLAGSGGPLAPVGDIVFITAIVVHGVILAIHSPLVERQAKSLLFVLSLPISPVRYVIAKMAACLIAFLVPWLAVTVLVVGSAVSAGTASEVGAPYATAMMLFLLANFSLLLAIGLLVRSELGAIAAIIITNTLVPLFLGSVLPAIAGSTRHDWNGPIVLVIAAELALLAAAMVMPPFVISRRREFP